VVDTLTHKLNGCCDHEGHAEFEERWIKAIAAPNIVLGSSCGSEGVFCSIDGFPCQWGTFRFDSKATIYTDGSARDVQWPAIACAAGAAYQVDANGSQRVAWASLPMDFPRSAVAAEYFAVSLARRACEASWGLGQGPLIVSDCSAVVASFRSLGRHLGYKSKFAGLWREPSLGTIAGISKVPAHLTRLRLKVLGAHTGGREMTRLIIGPSMPWVSSPVEHLSTSRLQLQP